MKDQTKGDSFADALKDFEAAQDELRETIRTAKESLRKADESAARLRRLASKPASKHILAYSPAELSLLLESMPPGPERDYLKETTFMLRYGGMPKVSEEVRQAILASMPPLGPYQVLVNGRIETRHDRDPSPLVGHKVEYTELASPRDLVSNDPWYTGERFDEILLRDTANILTGVDWFPVVHEDFGPERQPEVLTRIPFAMIAPREARAIANHGTSLKVLKQRGGLNALEVLAVLEDLPFGQYCQERRASGADQHCYDPDDELRFSVRAYWEQSRLAIPELLPFPIRVTDEEVPEGFRITAVPFGFVATFRDRIEPERNKRRLWSLERKASRGSLTIDQLFELCAGAHNLGPMPSTTSKTEVVRAKVYEWGAQFGGKWLARKHTTFSDGSRSGK